MMHSNDGRSGGVPPPALGAALLLELGSLIVSSRQPAATKSAAVKTAKTASGDRPNAAHHRKAATRNTEPGTSGIWNDVQLHQRILAAKLLNRSSQERPSTSTGKPITDVQAKVAALSRENSGAIQASAVSTAVARARRALFIDKHLKGHLEGLWNEHIPLSIEVLLGPDCPECFARASDPQDPETGHADVTRDGLLLLERWTLSIYQKKAHENTQQITSQWLLNAVRSQLHFSQISAWNAKIRDEGNKRGKSPKKSGQETGETRQRKLSRETCNFKKLESNCDDPQLLHSSGSCTGRPKSQTEARKNLNIVYSLKIPGETYKMAEFTRTPTEHTFPVTDIGSNVFLRVTLESLPRSEDVPVVRCICSSGIPGTMKRRRSKECLPLDELLNITSSDSSESYDLRCKGATFSPDLTIINPNMGCASGISRRLSIFTSPDNLDYRSSLSRGSTPEKQPFNDSGFPQSSEDPCGSRCKRPFLDPSLYSKVPGDNIFHTNFMLVDDRMQTPCSESGKHKCYCDEEPEHSGLSNFGNLVTVGDNSEKSKLERKYLKELAKQRRKMRKEAKLSKLKESEDGSSESRDDDKNLELESNCDKIGSHFHERNAERRYGKTATSIPILQASRFDRFLGSFRQPAFLVAQGRKATPCSGTAACQCSSLRDRTTVKVMISVSTQTEPMTCDCGNSVSMKCGQCDGVPIDDRPSMKRSDGSHDLAGISKSEILLEAMERTSRRHELAKSKTAHDSGDDSAREEVRDSTHNCDNNIRNLINQECDIYDRLDGSDSFKANSHNLTISDSNMLKGDLEQSFGSLIKRPKLKRFMPIIDRIDKVLTDRVKIKTKVKTNETDDSASNGDDVTTTNEEVKPLNRRKNSSTSDDDFVVYERGDYGTFASPDGTYDPIEDLDVAQSGDTSDVPSSSDMVRFRWRLDSAASMVFHANTGLPLTSSPAPLKRGNTCFDYDSSINSVSSIRSALFQPVCEQERPCWSPCASPCLSPCLSPSPHASPAPPRALARPATPPPRPRALAHSHAHHGDRIRSGSRSGLLGTFEESALKGRLEPAATVAGFTAELGASGAFCPPHRRLPVTVFFYSLGGNAAPYLGHINLGGRGYCVPASGTIQVTLLNPSGTVVKMFVVPYDLRGMPPACRTFLRQRTLYLPAGASAPAQAPTSTPAPTSVPAPALHHKWLRYLIHLRFMTSKSGKLYLHTDIRIIVSRKADLDTAAAHSPLTAVRDKKQEDESEREREKETATLSRRLNRSEACQDLAAILTNGCRNAPRSEEISYELRSFTYAPDNPKFSPR